PSFASPHPRSSTKDLLIEGSTVEHGPRQLRRLSADPCSKIGWNYRSFPIAGRASLLIMLQHQLLGFVNRQNSTAHRQHFTPNQSGSGHPQMVQSEALTPHHLRRPVAIAVRTSLS